jgi:hypothetical protein
MSGSKSQVLRVRESTLIFLPIRLSLSKGGDGFIEELLNRFRYENPQLETILSSMGKCYGRKQGNIAFRLTAQPRAELVIKLRYITGT